MSAIEEEIKQEIVNKAQEIINDLTSPIGFVPSITRKKAQAVLSGCDDLLGEMDSDEYVVEMEVSE